MHWTGIATVLNPPPPPTFASITMTTRLSPLSPPTRHRRDLSHTSANSQTSRHSHTSYAEAEPTLADTLDENARLWKRIHALQARSHDMCAENVDLRRQLNTLRIKGQASSPLSLTPDVPWQPSSLPTPVSASSSSLQPASMRRDVERLEDDNSRLLTAASEARATIRHLGRQVDHLSRERERCTCRLRERERWSTNGRPESYPSHRRSSSNSEWGPSPRSPLAPGEWERRSPHPTSPRRKQWDWEKERRLPQRYSPPWEHSPPDLVGGHMRTTSLRSVGEH